MDPASYWQETLIDFMRQVQDAQLNYWSSAQNIAQIYQNWMQHITLHPDQLYKTQTDLFEDYLHFWEHFQKKMLGKSPDSFIPVPPSDKRFLSADWQDNPIFYFYHQLYLLFVKHCLEFISKNPSSDPKLTKQIAFFSRQALNALSPSNFLLTNPDALKRTIETQGENLAKGYKNFLKDFSKEKGLWDIQMTDMEAFEVGKNLAITPGEVIFQNELFQLIQYYPTTEVVYEAPLLMVPAWINKYYIFDLREDNSYIKWIIDKGMTVFVISWVNPDESYRNTGFEDYLFEGLLSALDVIQSITSQKEINVLGFCVGGTLLAIALAYLKEQDKKIINSATFLATLIDFLEPGDIEVFIDEKQVSDLETKMQRDGYLDGRAMKMTFNLLHVNDLHWSYFINNYLFGQTPFPFDFLYWNSDVTHLPAKAHSEYLRKLYLYNQLSSGNLMIAGKRLDLHDVTVPSFFLSTEKDHIAPWQTTFVGATLLGGEVKFVLGGSGHIAGVINPPLSHKYNYRTNVLSPRACETPEKWLASSVEHEGSWWEEWMQWLSGRSGEKIVKRIPGEGDMPILQAAPGDYVKKKINKI